MCKFAGFILSAALLALAGCSTTPGNDREWLPREWSLTNSVPPPPKIPPPLNVTNKTATIPATNAGAQLTTAKPVSPLTLTSLNRWAAENKLSAPRKLAGSPVASYAVTSANGTMILAIGSREATWRGGEIHLGFPPELVDDQIFVHAPDLQKNLAPLLLGAPLTFPATNRVIVIDPGHGGSNTGTRSVLDGRFEKEFTLDWAQRLKPLLETNGWQVFLTRTNDAYVTNADRVVFAEAHHADVFISLHFNSAAPNQKQAGLEIYCLTPTGMPSMLTRGYSDLWTDHFPNNDFDAENLALAVRLQAALLRGSGEEDRGVRHARFMGVLQGQRRPAVLIEGGYLSNPREAKLIESGEFRQKLAEAVADALK